MAILYMAAAGQRRRLVALSAAAIALGIVLAWGFGGGAPDSGLAPAPDLSARRVTTAPVPAEVTECDANCLTARLAAPAVPACVAAVEELAGFGARWTDADASTPKFDRYGQRRAMHDVVTLTGNRAEFRNAAGAYAPVQYDCEFDLTTRTVIAARVRPR